MCRPERHETALDPDERALTKDLFLLRSDVKLLHVHRARRTLVTAATCAGLALGLVATMGLAVAAPISLPDASASSFSAPGSAVPVSSAPTLDAVTTGAAQAKTDASSVLDRADAVRADVAATGLPLSIGDSSIDTAALEDAVDRLGSTDLLPVLLVPALSQNAQSEVERVTARVDEVQSSLDQAKALLSADASSFIHAAGVAVDLTDTTANAADLVSLDSATTGKISADALTAIFAQHEKLLHQPMPRFVRRGVTSLADECKTGPLAVYRQQERVELVAALIPPIQQKVLRGELTVRIHVLASHRAEIVLIQLKQGT